MGNSWGNQDLATQGPRIIDAGFPQGAVFISAVGIETQGRPRLPPLIRLVPLVGGGIISQGAVAVPVTDFTTPGPRVCHPIDGEQYAESWEFQLRKGKDRRSDGAKAKNNGKLRIDRERSRAFLAFAVEVSPYSAKSSALGRSGFKHRPLRVSRLGFGLVVPHGTRSESQCVGNIHPRIPPVPMQDIPPDNCITKPISG